MSNMNSTEIIPDIKPRVNDSYKELSNRKKKSVKKTIFAFSCSIFILILFYYIFSKHRSFPSNLDNRVNPENFEVNVYEKLVQRNNIFPPDYSQVCQTTKMDRMFLNGLIRKYRPKKCLEVGVANGCSSIIILNAIIDLDEAFLYSIDALNITYDTGEELAHFAKNNFPELLFKWKLYPGGQAYKFIEEIGKGIEFVFLDTTHFLPGETLDFLQFLPFLAENAIVSMHDINFGWLPSFQNSKVSNTLLFTYLRGKKIIPEEPNGELYIHGTGAVIMERNQKNYYFDYFFAMGNTWQYLISENEFNELVAFFRKYYDEKYIELFKSAYNAHKKGKYD